MIRSSSKKILLVLVAFLCAAALSALTAWYKMARVVPQPAWITADKRDDFLYGSVKARDNSGIPYWIWLSLPRLFPEYLPGPGGYASLGFSWEETREMPTGFAKQTMGFVRVRGNCAICHTYSRSNGPDAAPTVFVAGPGHTAEVEKLMTFYKQCAEDPRFNAGNIMGEVAMETRLSFLDRLIYRYILIPGTRKRLLDQNAVILDRHLRDHAQNPSADPALRQRMRELQADLQQPEKDEVGKYLTTLR